MAKPGPMGTTTAPAPAAPEVSVPQMAMLTVLAVVVGLAAGAGASAFVAVQHHLQHWLWHTLPGLIGQEHAPWWMVLTLPIVGAALTYGALQLPGHGGHSPLDGFGLDIGPREVGSVVLAALASLSFGAVLGPEAPLMSVGTALGVLAFRNPKHPARQVMAVVGAMAAVGAIFGNPMVTAILLLEVALAAGAAMATPAVMLPAISGLAASYLLQVGVGGWTGLGETRLSMPGLPAYPEVQLLDLAVALPLAFTVAVVAILARLGGEQINKVAKRSPLPTLLVAGAVTGLSAVAVTAITGSHPELVLFAGQTAMVDYVALSAVGTSLIILAGKAIAYLFSLGGGFRGGSIFPAMALGTILAAVAVQLVAGSSISALTAAVLAAATAASLRMPFTAVLLGALMTFSAGGATTELAILGAVVGLLTRLAAERKMPVLAPHAH